jgi:N-acetylglucosaminyldiphosphoundecaprenol N-acetyl-beta-D-mannosaminyltransferase
MGVPITAHTPLSAAAAVVSLARETGRDRLRYREGSPGLQGHDVHLVNAYTLALADRDPGFGDTLRASSLNLPDGQPVVWANRLLHRGLSLPAVRVYGPDLLLNVFRTGQSTGLRHFLLGSTPRVLAAMRRELHRRFPQACIAGVSSPPFRPMTSQEMARQEHAIRTAGADIVWVGLGTPQQDRRAAELSRTVPAVFVAVGAAFDFIAGTKRQASPWIQQHGLEWLFRLVNEPGRLWRRYLFGNARFVRGIARQAAAGPAPHQTPMTR